MEPATVDTGLNAAAAAPELILALGAMALLMLGVFRGNRATGTLTGFAIALIGIAVLAVSLQPSGTVFAFGGLFIADTFARFMKCLIAIGAAGALFMSLGFIRAERVERFEYPVLILLATLGMMMMVSSNDLISLYMGLELQSLSLYVIASFNRDSLRSTEAGLKYFVLGALSSGMLLYGASLIYGFTGTTDFAGIAQVVGGDKPSLGVIVGLVFVLAGLAFKISAVPFHMWTPDVYEGAPTPVTAFFAAAPKIAAMGLILRTMMVPFGEAADEWRQIIVFVALASMILGAFAAIGQNNIKRLMAYSSIGHMGYALVGLAAGTEAGISGVITYMAIYLPMTLGAFGVILAMRRSEGMVESLDDLAGLSRHQPLLAFAFAMLLFSLAGIPPLAGFFGKLYVFLAAVEAELYTLAVIGVLSSVVGAYYYVRIIKIMYMDEPAERFVSPLAPELRMVIALATIFVIFFVALAGPLGFLEEVASAAASLHPPALAVP